MDQVSLREDSRPSLPKAQKHFVLYEGLDEEAAARLPGEALAEMRERLGRMVAEGVEDSRPGRVKDGPDVMARLRAKLATPSP